jgi:hypothetical protein
MTKDQITQRKNGLVVALDNLEKQSGEIAKAMQDLQQASTQTQLQIVSQQAAIAECDYWLSEIDKEV